MFGNSSWCRGSLVAAFCFAFGTACSTDQEAQEPQESMESDAAADDEPEAPPAEPSPSSQPAIDPPASLPPPASPPSLPAAVDAKPAVDPSLPTMWAFADSVAILATPDVGAKRVGTLKYGEKVGVIADQGEWIKIGEGQFVARKNLTDRKAFWGKKGGKGRTPPQSRPAKQP